MIRIALLGAGSHSRYNHGPGLRAAAAKYPDLVELAAVCDLDADRAQAYADDFGFRKVYTDVHQMIDQEQLDGIVAITPVPLTEQIACALLPYRIPLVIEKPPGPDSASTARIIEVADEYGTPHMVSLNRRFGPPRQRALQWLASQTDPRPVRLAVSRMLRFNRREPEFNTSTGIHIVDATLSLVGEPERVCACHLPSSTEGARLTQACVDFTNGNRAHIFLSPVVGNLEETYELHGEDYTVKIDDGAGSLQVWDHNQLVEEFTVPEDAEPAYRNGTFGEMEHFVLAVAGRADFTPDLRAARTSLMVAEAIDAGGEHDMRA